jgi:ferredoxin
MDSPLITVDVARCVGAGQCALAAPEVFDQDENEGTVVVRHPRPPAEHWGKVAEAADLCPAQVIRVGQG